MLRRSLGLLVVTAACSSEPSRRVSEPIIKGTASDASQDAVVMLVALDGGFGSCTATLIAPNLVLTARHCVSNVDSQPFSCDVNGKLVGYTGTQVGADHRANRLVVYTGRNAPNILGGAKPAAIGMKIFHDDATALCSHDLSLLLLDRDVTDVPFAQIRLEDPIKLAETFTAVGWGYTESGTPGVRQQRAGVKILAVGPNAGAPPTPPNDFKVGEAICSGDSGGPALDSTTNAIVGVVSRGGNGMSDPNDPSVGCLGATNFYTSTPPFKDLILQAFAEAGHDPWLEGGPDPRLAKLGEACASGADCRSGVCAPFEGGSLCSQDCSADGACPAGYDCKAQGGQSLCLPHRDPPPPAPPAPPSSGGCSAGGTAPRGAPGGAAIAALALLSLASRAGGRLRARLSGSPRNRTAAARRRASARPPRRP